MIDLATVERVRAYPGATDMRLGQYGLRKLVMEDEEPRPGTLYLFCSKDRRRIRILEVGDDFVWLHECRARVGRFKWPKRKGEPIERPTMLQIAKGCVAIDPPPKPKGKTSLF